MGFGSDLLLILDDGRILMSFIGGIKILGTVGPIPTLSVASGTSVAGQAVYWPLDTAEIGTLMSVTPTASTASAPTSASTPAGSTTT